MNDQVLAVDWRIFRRVWLFCALVLTINCFDSAATGQGLSRLPPIELSGPEPPPATSLPSPEPVPTPTADAEVAAPPVPTEEGEPAFVAPWYYPSVYFSKEVWKNTFEVGVNGATGNSETLSFRVGADLQRKVDNHVMKAKFSYLRTNADGELTQNNGNASMQHDWQYDESRWSIFWKTSANYDEFKAFDYRVLTSAGFAYAYIDNDTTTLKGRFGPGVSREFGGPDDEYVGEVVWGLDFDHEINDRQNIEVTTEYRPEWEAPRDFLLESKISWAVKLNESGNLSLKTTITDRYDSTPQGAKFNDLDYGLLLLLKL